MKIAVVGGGSIGLLFASYLADDNDVTLYTRSSEQANLLSEKGLHLIKDSHLVKKTSLKATQFENWTCKEELTIITVKQYDLGQVINKIVEETNKDSSTYLFVQNGMGHLEQVKRIENNNIIIASVEHGALRSNPFTINHTGAGLTRIANFNGSASSEVIEYLLENSSEQFPFHFENDYEEMLTKKLIVNIMINPLTALLNVTNGKLISNDYYYEIFKDLYDELCEVFQIEERDEVFKHVLNVCKKTANNKSSMLKDILEGRKTEIEAILGYALTVAEKQNCKTPLMTSLYKLIKGKELLGGQGN